MEFSNQSQRVAKWIFLKKKSQLYAAETLQGKKEWTDIFKVSARVGMGVENYKQRILYPENQ